MKRFFLLFIVFINALLGACTDDNINTTPDNEGFVLEVEEGRVLVAKDISMEKFNEIKDKSVSDFDGLNGVPLIYLSYDNAGSFDKGDEVEFWIDDGVDDSYPQQARAKKISLLE